MRGYHLDLLVHPLPLSALAVLLLNDHWLKAAHPGWLSGKLSDVAVLALLPFVILATADLAAMAVRRLPAPGRLAMTLAVLGSAALFAVIEVTPLGADAYRWGLGIGQWPVHAVAAALDGLALPSLRPVALTADAGDLLALPAAAAILLLRGTAGWQAGASSSGERPATVRAARPGPEPRPGGPVRDHASRRPRRGRRQGRATAG